MTDVQASINVELKRATLNEQRLLHFLNTNTTRTFKKTKNEFDCFDLRSKSNGSTIYIELKTRFIPKDKYPTTIIGTNKIQHATKKGEKKHRQFIYIFEYNKKYFFIEHSTKLFSTFQTRIITRQDRQVSKLHTEIPVKLLKPISELILQ